MNPKIIPLSRAKEQSRDNEIPAGLLTAKEIAERSGVRKDTITKRANVRGIKPAKIVIRDGRHVHFFTQEQAKLIGEHAAPRRPPMRRKRATTITATAAPGMSVVEKSHVSRGGTASTLAQQRSKDTDRFWESRKGKGFPYDQIRDAGLGHLLGIKPKDSR